MQDCKFCGNSVKKLSYQQHLRYHLGRSKDDKELTKKIKDEIETIRKENKEKFNYSCPKCMVGFSNKQNLTRHLKGNSCGVFTLHQKIHMCLNKIKDAELKEEMRGLLGKAIPDMEPDIINYHPQSTINNNTTTNSHNMNNSHNTTTNTTNSHNTTNNNNSNINIYPVQDANPENYGKFNRVLEDTEILYKFFTNMSIHEDTETALLSVHDHFSCNKRYPELQNIYVSNLRKDSSFQVKEDGEWQVKPGSQRKKYFTERVKDCSELYQNTIPYALSNAYPQYAKKIDRLTDKMSAEYSEDIEGFKKRLWPKFCGQVHANAKEVKKIKLQDEQK